ncbi:hypothetical protein, partial [Zooshikella sp. RANM57]|uniref:hypothetical protein n=1 Tax=Zooshikella sp. RANM57 TaxID=3425863 RepID=UPI003D6DB70A
MDVETRKKDTQRVLVNLDHLMIEVNDPYESAMRVSDRFGLPLAWPLIEDDKYTSVGLNFGELNIEFINFNVRFGISAEKFNGFSGIAFKELRDITEIKNELNEQGISYRIGEEATAHTTITMEEGMIFPTLFLVKYNFDTSDWTNKLKNDFEKCAGGKFNIGHLISLEIAQSIPVNTVDSFWLRMVGCTKDRNCENAVVKVVLSQESIFGKHSKNCF